MSRKCPTPNGPWPMTTAPPSWPRAEHSLQAMLAYQVTLDPATDWQRFQRHYVAAHPETRAEARPPAQLPTEKNENMEEQFARPPAPIRPAQDVPAGATRHPAGSPARCRKNENVEEQILPTPTTPDRVTS